LTEAFPIKASDHPPRTLSFASLQHPALSGNADNPGAVKSLAQ
jgi:hypothetical protein